MTARDYEGAGANGTVRAMMASTVHTWETPPDLFAELDAEFRFTLDPCCVPETAKCARYFTPADDGLAQSWAGERVFMNPPYGRELVRWMSKARSEAHRGATVVCLVPARTDTAWWHDTVVGFAEIRFIRGRVAFLLDGKKGDPTFSSALVIYRPPIDYRDVLKQLENDLFQIEQNKIPALLSCIAGLRALIALECATNVQPKPLNDETAPKSGPVT